MILTETKIIDQITVTENGVVSCREATRILKDGQQLSQSYHRWTIAPGEDYSEQPDNVKAICAAAHTPEVITAYQAQQEALRNLGQ